MKNGKNLWENREETVANCSLREQNFSLINCSFVVREKISLGEQYFMGENTVYKMNESGAVLEVESCGSEESVSYLEVKFIVFLLVVVSVI